VFEERSHRELFTDEIKFERFYWYLRCASQNSFIHLAYVFTDKMIEVLEEMKQPMALEWFVDTLTGEECNWMICHLGAGFSNYNSSTEVHWRNLRESFGDAGRSSDLLHGNFTILIKDNSRKLFARYVDEHWLSAYDSGGNYSKGMYETQREMPKMSIVAIDVWEGDEDELDNLRRMIMDRSETTITCCAKTSGAFEQTRKIYHGVEIWRCTYGVVLYYFEKGKDTDVQRLCCEVCEINGCNCHDYEKNVDKPKEYFKVA